MKKRDFGKGKWNGFGGKVHEEEEIHEAAERELLEEACLKLKNKKALQKRGVMYFSFEDTKDEEVIEVNVFGINSAQIIGEPEETDEMRPAWFRHHEIPFDKMWVDDQYWMEYFLRGDNFYGEFLFNKDGSKILSKKLEIK